jgi:thiosulfate/3-mercaptopyruvate sulfurtransferase
MRCLTAALLVAAVFNPSMCAAQVANGSSRDKLVVTAAWLAQQVKDPDIVILQVGRKETFDAGHIPGARLVDYDRRALAARDQGPGALALEMPTTEALRAELAALGISDNSRVVVVPSDNYWAPSTRIVLTLDYAGLSNVMWLDGGVKGWTDNGQPLSSEVPTVKPGNLSPLRLRPVVVDAEFVRAHLKTPGFAIVDARNRSFYEGTAPLRMGGGAAPKPGHIPGALSAPYDSFATGVAEASSTTLKPAAEIGALFTAAGVKPGDTVVGYCHIGQQATAMLFAARTQGYNVLLYDGSFTDWEKRDLPVENPSATRGK